MGLTATGVTKPDVDTRNGNELTYFKPDDKYRYITRAIVRTLNKHHYKDITLDDEFSSKIFDLYLKSLDPGKNHFFAEDIESVEKYREELDDKLIKGDLTAAFDIYNRFHERRLQRLNFLLDDLPGKVKAFDFERIEYIKRDREDLPWLSNQENAHDLWRRILKNDVLNLRFTDKSSEEIVQKLEKRYRAQLNLLKQTNNDDVFEIFMSAFTHSYDPHTDYFPPRQSENFDIHMRLSLEGIGALLQREDEYIKVVRLIPAGPAERSKLLKPADRIVGVGQGDEEIVDVVGWRLDDVVDLIRGPKGSTVRLNLLAADSTDATQIKTISIVRDRVKLEEQSAKKKLIDLSHGEANYKIGVIELPAFYVDFKAALAGDPNYRSSTRDVEKLIRELREENVDALIVDLRNNGGGSLQEANDLTGLFISTGPVVQIRTAKNRVELIRDMNPKVAYDGPVAVLVNRLSASASEIFAGAIQDHGRGIVIGSQTFGKGTVQNINPLEPGQIKYTQAKFYRVSGDSTQARGIIPDILLPELLNNEEIGENTLPEALPWDRISPARYTRLNDLQPVIELLKKQHEQRIVDHPDFDYMLERIALLEESRNKERISLNETQRTSEREQSEQRLLMMENKRRNSKGLKPFKDFAELESNEEQQEENGPNESILAEVGHILLDWLTITQNKYALSN